MKNIINKLSENGFSFKYQKDETDQSLYVYDDDFYKDR